MPSILLLLLLLLLLPPPLPVTTACKPLNPNPQGEPRPKNGATSPAEQIRKLTAENKRLTEQKAALERRAAAGKAPGGSEDSWRLRDEIRCGRGVQRSAARQGTRGQRGVLAAARRGCSSAQLHV